NTAKARAGKGFQRALCGFFEQWLLDALAGISLGKPHGRFTHQLRILKGSAQVHELAHRMVFINRETHIAKRLGRGASHAGQKHRDAVQLDGQHIVCVFGCLAVFAHNTVVYAWADVFQVFIIGANGTAGDRSNVLDQRFGLWLGIITQVFDVNDTKFGELHLDALLAFAANEELSGLANHAIHREFVVTRPTQGIPGQFDGTATVIQTGLVNRDALVTERLIDLDGLLKRLARFAVGNQYLAFETAGHAGRVVIHQEAVKTNRERQGL